MKCTLIIKGDTRKISLPDLKSTLLCPKIVVGTLRVVDLGLGPYLTNPLGSRPAGLPSNHLLLASDGEIKPELLRALQLLTIPYLM